MRSLMPNWLLSQYRRLRIAHVKEVYAKMDTASAFSTIYRTAAWGMSTDADRPFYSGSGSHDEGAVGSYVAAVLKFFETLPAKPDVIDLGCGDFHVGSQLRFACNNYIACDIVPELINHNRARFQNLNVDFRVLDLTRDPIPKADVAIVRQVLQHLSNNLISAFVQKISGSAKWLVLTEHLPAESKFIPNVDIASGPMTRLIEASGVVLTLPPFGLSPIREEVLGEWVDPLGRIRTTLFQIH